MSLAPPDPVSDRGDALLRAVRALCHHPHLPHPVGWALRSATVGLVSALSSADAADREERLDRCETYVAVCGAHLGLIPPVTEVLAALARLKHAIAVRPAPVRVSSAPPTLEPHRWC